MYRRKSSLGVGEYKMEVYDRVPQEDNFGLPNSSVDDEDPPKVSLEPLEIDLEAHGARRTPTPSSRRRFTEPLWLVSVSVSVVLVIPSLLATICLTYSLLGRIFPATVFVVHLTIVTWASRDRIPNQDEDEMRSPRRFALLRRWTPSMLDVVLFWYTYSGINRVLINGFFTDLDGTPVIEWDAHRRWFISIQRVGLLVVVFRVVQETVSFSLVCYHRIHGCRVQDDHRFPTRVVTALATLKHRCNTMQTERHVTRLRLWLRRLLTVLALSSLLMLAWCVDSVVVHLFTWDAPAQSSEYCDPLDTTECFFPFPSFRHMVPDETTATGWRVHLRNSVLPPLKGGGLIHPDFLNELDGFSTMAPLMFYMFGMKEADEMSGEVRLQGVHNISESVTQRSITLLVDVQAQTLVPHSAEIDHLDPERPVVLVFPAQPFKHNTHYALAVVGATNVYGARLPPTKGMQDLRLNDSGGTSLKDSERRQRYRASVIPALVKAAPWLDLDNDPEVLQLLFDFPTISEESQLGPVRSVRDATIAHIESNRWGAWSNHARAVRIDDFACDGPNDLIARTIHGELDVPWFIGKYGSGQRGSFLDASAVATQTPVSIGKAKFMVQIPCSLRSAALKGPDARDLRAVVEFGHGLFANRGESREDFLRTLANDNGYIITAMDWRGMSSYDLLHVVETLMSNPRHFQFVRDNLIQGYANKLALQHFSRHGMLDLRWFQFRSRPIPLFQGQPPAFTFYGISQGGILGAGYSALSGPTGLIDRVVLGSPGASFALVLSRSEAFIKYDTILLLNFYNNRHIRLLISLVQMAWDSVEGSGVLAGSLTDPFPPTLIQAGLGDSTVTTISTEALARAYGASTLPNNPRPDIFGIPTISVSKTDVPGPSEAFLTEILYDEEYRSLPLDDRLAPRNQVHVCARKDPRLMTQVSSFLSSGHISNPCEHDGCRRHRVTCGFI